MIPIQLSHGGLAYIDEDRYKCNVKRLGKYSNVELINIHTHEIIEVTKASWKLFQNKKNINNNLTFS